VDWFKGEALRAYRRLDGGGADTADPADRARRELLDWMRDRGGAATVTDLVRGPRRYRGDSEKSRHALEALVQAGLASSEYPPPGAKGGRPATVYRLTGTLSPGLSEGVEAKTHGGDHASAG
jgi:predicted metal-dependent phosphoesterase TrpH